MKEITQLEACIAFVMEDLMDFRRRLPYADMLEDRGCHHAATKQREFVKMCEQAKEIQEWSVIIRVVTKNGTVLMIYKKNANTKPMFRGNAHMRKQKTISNENKTRNMKIHKRAIFRQHRAKSPIVQS